MTAAQLPRRAACSTPRPGDSHRPGSPQVTARAHAASHTDMSGTPSPSPGRSEVPDRWPAQTDDELAGWAGRCEIFRVRDLT
jgi:hypothetical protein